MVSEKIIHKSITIKAPASKVWETLTNVELMKKWIADTETEILTNWVIGSPIVIRLHFNGALHVNKGTILKFESQRVLQYNYWSNISRLPDKPENYSTVEFKLTEEGDQTELTVIQSHFPAEASFEHSDFYWNGTLKVLKKLVEL